MTTDTREKVFQKDFYEHLVNTGYTKRTTDNYDIGTCLDKELVLKFIKTTQPIEWKKFAVHNGGEDSIKAENNFINSLVSQINNKGTIEVLKQGFRDIGNFKLFYPKPYTSLNPDLVEKYNQNIFSVVDELEYQNREHGNRLDLVIFINGIPISTIELKDTFSQGVENAINQYKYDRDPREQLFKNCLIHFAMSDEKIYMTSKLAGKNTRFLPFNKGIENPIIEDDYKTSYLYTEILQKSQLSRLINNFIFEEDEIVIFPRFHQLDCVNYLLKNPQPGQNYLVQHSAGSGKTKTIAWLAHNLLNKYDENNQRIYDMVIIISDRKVIDKQLQDQVKAIEKRPGVVEVIENNSDQLAQAIKEGSNIIVSTLHKFSYIIDKVGDLENRTYAVIIDEAHSSQTGAHASNLKNILSDAELDELDLLDTEDYIEIKLKESMTKRSHTPNISFFAFTATPKNKTLELFGHETSAGNFIAHHLYSMEQAIEEDFILDVLKNYLNHKTYFKLIQRALDDPEYDEIAAKKVLMKFIQKHPNSIEAKTSIMLDHFVHSTVDKINGHAKAMVVASGREEAVKYKLEFDKQIKDKYNIKTLCAFTGEVPLNGKKYTESNINDIDNKSIKEAFKQDEYKILIVANKFQTGFDEPLLHTMYVDKILNDVAAVQTLSRLNRIHKDKNDTMVVDFVNDAETIQNSFEPYYKGTILSEATDYRKLYELMGNIFGLYVFDESDVDEFIEAYFNNASQQKLHNLLNKPIQEFKKLDKEQQVQFKKKLGKYQSIYSFLSQLLPFCDDSLEKLYIYNKILYKKLPTINKPLPYRILADVDVESFKVVVNENIRNLSLTGGKELNPIGGTDSGYREEEKVRLSEIVKTLNEIAGDIKFGPEDDVQVKLIIQLLMQDEELMEYIANNPQSTVKDVFDEPFEKALAEAFKSDMELYNKIQSNIRLKLTLKKQTLSYLYLQQKASLKS